MRPYLAELRRKGRRLLEVGMLADRRESAARGIGALFSMMRWAVHYALHTDLTDVVIGVHPRHAQFYERCYGFEVFAPPTSYPLVRNHLVVGLRLRLREGLAKDVLPRGLADARDNPIPASAFAHRFAFVRSNCTDPGSRAFCKPATVSILVAGKPARIESNVVSLCQPRRLGQTTNPARGQTTRLRVSHARNHQPRAPCNEARQ